MPASQPLRVIVTGGSGKVGRYAIAALLACESPRIQVILNADVNAPPPNTPWIGQVPFLKVQLACWNVE